MTAGLVLAQAWLIANTISDVVVHHQGMAQVRSLVVLLLAWSSSAARWSPGSESVRRARLGVGQVGPADRPGGADRSTSGRPASTASAPGSLVVLATSGIDALDSYFARYLPQLFLAVIVPVTVIVVMLGADWISAVIIAVTVPLIPLFMALVGASTKVRMRRQARLLQRLAGHFLDVVAGLPTLKVFGRAKAQVAAVRDITNRYRTATMATLKVAFLSSLILELLATFSVALVAVAVGLRLLGGHLSLATALFVLILAPEAYLPLRLLGTQLPRQRRRDEGGRGRLRGAGATRSRRRAAGRDVPDPSTSSCGSTNSRSATRAARSLPSATSPSPSSPGRWWPSPVPVAAASPRLLAVLLGLVPASTRLGHRRRCRSGRPRPRCVEDPDRLGPAAPAPVRPLHRRQRPTRPT